MPTVHDLDTPSILIDAARAEANIARAQAHEVSGNAWRMPSPIARK